MRKAIYLVFIFLQVQLSFSQNNNEVDSLLTVVKTAPDSIKANIYLDLAVAYRTLNVGEAYEYALTGIQLADNKGYIQIKADGHNILGSIFTVLGDFEKANLQLHEALKLNELLGSKKGVANTSNSLGVLYFNQKDYQNALKYYQKAFALVDSTAYPAGYATFSLNIGEVYQVVGDFKRAKPLLQNALQIFLEVQDFEGLAYSYGILARIAFDERNFLQALELCNKSLSYFDLDRNDLGKVEYKLFLSEIYGSQNIYVAAEKSAQEALSLAKVINSLQWAMNSHERLAELYKEKKIFERAYYHIDSAKELRTQILDEKGQQQINNMRIIYETDSLIQENKLLVINSELHEKTLYEQKAITIIIAVCLMVIFIFTMVIYRANRIKQKKNFLLSAQNEEIRQQQEEILTQAEGLKYINKEISHKNELIESKNKDITDSLNYAKRIQTALLPFKNRIEKGIPESFILHKAKDIVSGDFYWYKESEDNIIIAVADCTGHGIPGAFMSFIGHDLLNYLCNIKKVTSPSAILKEMKRSVIRLLRQEHGDNRDGLDISICMWDKAKKELTFSGANHSLIYIQNNNLFHIKGDRTTIGKDYKGNYEDFKEHTISLTTDTAFYLYTDGFVDQFGGPKNKKFMVAPFKELLLKNHLKQMQTQGQILTETLEEWMKDAEQVDDILVFGFRLFD